MIFDFSADDKKLQRTHPKIKSNKIRCKNCGDIIESRHCHDFVWCSCGQCAVDGGKLYLKRAFKTDDPDEAIEELSEYEDEEETL